MRSRPDLILIGSTGRNAGKTEFACELIRAHAPRLPVTAVKITVIRESSEACPRGGDGCGVCASVEDRFVLTEERDPGNGKDTGRMLRAGAHRVLWLRVLQGHLDEGVAALLEALPEGGAVVCESNSARAALEPGLFLMLKPREARSVKASAAAVMPLADRLVTFSGAGWDLDPRQCRCHGGTWTLAAAASALILAGGQSRRMGQDKSLLPVEGRPLIERLADHFAPHFAQVLVSANDPSKYAFLDLPIIPDETPGQGPLMGILSGLKAAAFDPVLVLACDIPVVDLAFVKNLLALAERADVVMPVSEDGRLEPLFAVYRKTALPKAEAALAEGRRRIVAILPGLVTAHPPMPTGWYHNLNTPEDLAAFRQDGRPMKATGTFGP